MCGEAALGIAEGKDDDDDEDDEDDDDDSDDDGNDGDDDDDGIIAKLGRTIIMSSRSPWSGAAADRQAAEGEGSRVSSPSMSLARRLPLVRRVSCIRST